MTETWYHVTAVVKSHTDIQLYVNGANDGGTNYGTGGDIAYYATGHATIGARNGGTSDFFDGKIDDVRVYNKALSEKEINQLYRGGGGIYGNDTSATIDKCVITDNSALEGGGIAAFNGELSKCVVVGNSAEYDGGGFSDCSGTVENCVITANEATNRGGGLYNCDCSVINCTIVANKATAESGEGGGIYIYDNDTSPTVTNTILWNNSDTDGQKDESAQIHINSETVDVTYTCIQDYDPQGDLAGTGNIGDAPLFDPLFVGPDGPDGLGIDFDSPCIDEGDNTSESYDIVGNPRITDGDNNGTEIIDMGAYEVPALIGHWELNESEGATADDSSYDDNDGTLTNFPVDNSQWIDGVADNALKFDGEDDVINIGDPDDYDTNSNFTWSAWMRTLETDESDKKVISDGGVIMAHCPDNDTDYVRCLHVVNSTGDDDGKLLFNLGTTAILSSERRVDDGLWHLVAVTVKFDGENDVVKLYIDGVEEEDTWQGQIAVTSTTNVLRIGYANDDYDDCYDEITATYFDGKIDDVRIYNGALSEAQVRSFFDAPDYWRFVVACDSRDSGPISGDGINALILGEIADAVIAEKAEVLFFPGDLINNDDDSDSDDRQRQLGDWKTVMAPVYSEGITVMPIRGNHEVWGGGGPGNDWKYVFPYNEIPRNGPYGETFDERGFTYYIEHRNALFVGIDVYNGNSDNVNYHRVDLQIRNWLANAEENGILDLTTKQHVFVATHEPAFKINKTGLSIYPSYRNPFWEILEDEPGCRLYFCGHAHFYDHARIKNGDENPDTDVHQFVVGTAGAPISTGGGLYNGINGSWTPERVHYRGYEIETFNYGYVVVEVWGDNVTTHWKLRNANGSYLPDGDIFEYSVP